MNTRLGVTEKSVGSGPRSLLSGVFEFILLIRHFENCPPPRNFFINLV